MTCASASDCIASDEIAVEVPSNVTPGLDILRVHLEGGKGFADVRVPPQARAGDRLTLKRPADGGDWRCCSISRQTTMKLADGEPASALANSNEVSPRRSFVVAITSDAVPGVTQLRVNLGTGEAPLLLTVPKEATSRDELVVEQVEGKWHAHLRVATVVDRAPEGPSDEATPMMSLASPYTPVDPVASFEAMVLAARAAGARVSSKLCRGSAPPLHIMGVLAAQAVAEGEDLCWMPGDLCLSAESCREALPDIYNAVIRLEAIPRDRREDAAHAACFASILADAAQRARCGVARGASTTASKKLWDRYADVVLGEDFEHHPYWRSFFSFDELDASMRPSTEASSIQRLAMNVMAIYSMIHNDALAREAIGPHVDAGIFLHAQLAILSRVFATSGGATALVPVTDCCNHTQGVTATWEWCEEERAHVLRACRNIMQGEEILISYGPTSNPLLFRTYGFTLPPDIEPSWSCLLQPDLFPPEDTEDLSDMPGGLHGLLLDTTRLHETFTAVFEACRGEGRDPLIFLRDLCSRSLKRYLRDARLTPYLDALARQRAKAPASGAWWEECAIEKGLGLLETSALRVNLSEFLCITAYIEIFDCLAGKLPAESCLERGAAARDALRALAGGMASR